MTDEQVARLKRLGASWFQQQQQAQQQTRALDKLSDALLRLADKEGIQKHYERKGDLE